MNDSPNYHGLNTCARDPKSPERLLLLTIFIMLSVIALGGLGEGGEAAVTGSIRASLGDPPPPVLCKVCQESLRAPFHQAELGDRRRLCPNSSCCGWDDFFGDYLGGEIGQRGMGLD